MLRVRPARHAVTRYRVLWLRVADGAVVFVLNRDRRPRVPREKERDPARRPLIDEMLDATSELPDQVRMPPGRHSAEQGDAHP
jgi:hypothetical protein